MRSLPDFLVAEYVVGWGYYLDWEAWMHWSLRQVSEKTALSQEGHLS